MCNGCTWANLQMLMKDDTGVPQLRVRDRASISVKSSSSFSDKRPLTSSSSHCHHMPSEHRYASTSVTFVLSEHLLGIATGRQQRDSVEVVVARSSNRSSKVTVRHPTTMTTWRHRVLRDRSVRLRCACVVCVALGRLWPSGAAESPTDC